MNLIRNIRKEFFLLFFKQNVFGLSLSRETCESSEGDHNSWPTISFPLFPEFEFFMLIKQQLAEHPY